MKYTKNVYTIEQLNKEIEATKQYLNDPDLCQGTASVWSRISGYFRPVHFGKNKDGIYDTMWNDGKVAEFNERLEYKIN